MNKKVLGLILPVFAAAIFCATNAQGQSAMTMGKYESYVAFSDIVFGTNNSGHFPQGVREAIKQNSKEKKVEKERKTMKQTIMTHGGPNANWIVIDVEDTIPVKDTIPTKKEKVSLKPTEEQKAVTKALHDFK